MRSDNGRDKTKIRTQLCRLKRVETCFGRFAVGLEGRGPGSGGPGRKKAQIEICFQGDIAWNYILHILKRKKHYKIFLISLLSIHLHSNHP